MEKLLCIIAWVLSLTGALFILFSLDGCNGDYRARAAIVSKANPLTIPPELSYCGHAGAYVARLPNVRTANGLANYANKLEISRENLLHDLELCNEKRQQLKEMVK